MSHSYTENSRKLTAGAKLTVKQASHLLLSQNIEHKERNTNFDKTVRLLADVLLPAGNILPPSLHLMERIVGVHAPAACSYHVCPNDCHSWDHLDKAQWEDCRDDFCPVCGLERFIKQTPSGAACLKPAKVCHAYVSHYMLTILASILALRLASDDVVRQTQSMHLQCDNE